MKTYLWEVNFDNGEGIVVSSTTVLNGIKDALWAYNKERNMEMKPKNIVEIKIYNS